jgi:hypothetical protein
MPEQINHELANKFGYQARINVVNAHTYEPDISSCRPSKCDNMEINKLRIKKVHHFID